LRAREPLLGTFVKLPGTQAIEIIGAAGFDFVVIDREHAPLGVAETDLMVLAARASNVAALVRVAGTSDGSVLSALDCGASGVMVPHVIDAGNARAVAASCRYAGGSRGFAGMTRASGWGARSGTAHMRAQDDAVACVAMIEDVAAVERIAEIAAVEGLDALFVGRGDLTASFGDDPGAKAKVAGLTARVAAAAGEAGVALMMLATGKADAEAMRGLGATAILVASDHNLLKAAASTAVADYSVAS
jgi:2-keto-3-deoxy-L-rhamnonate aldolase RhmA